jgi:hypothetical protein
LFFAHSPLCASFFGLLLCVLRGLCEKKGGAQLKRRESGLREIYSPQLPVLAAVFYFFPARKFGTQNIKNSIEIFSIFARASAWFHSIIRR